MNDDYDYTKSGFDAFLSRSVDKTPQINLSDQGPVSNTVAFDRTQVSGMIGDTIQIGNVHINKSNITMDDGNNTRLLIGAG